jgi:hypothetical protein
MKLRTAIKIQRSVEEPWRFKGRSFPEYRFDQYKKARCICIKKSHDNRVPFVTSESDRLESFGIMMSVLADALVDDVEKRDQIKKDIWHEIEDIKGK